MGAHRATMESACRSSGGFRTRPTAPLGSSMPASCSIASRLKYSVVAYACPDLSGRVALSQKTIFFETCFCSCPHGVNFHNKWHGFCHIICRRRVMRPMRGGLEPTRCDLLRVPRQSGGEDGATGCVLVSTTTAGVPENAAWPANDKETAAPKAATKVTKTTPILHSYVRSL
jgi:hypothetical protein